MGQGVCPDPLTEVGGQTVYLATVSGAIVDHTRSYSCYTTKDSAPYAYSYTGSGHGNDDDNLYFYLPNGEYVVSTGLANFTGTVNDGPAFLTKALVGTANLDISRGNITFSSTGVSGFDANGDPVEGEYAEYIITGTTSANVISVANGTHNITLDNCTISSTTAPPIDIASGCNITLNLSGSNSLTLTGERIGAPLHVVSGAYLTIQGSGSLTSTSNDGWGAGIGGGDGQASGNITISGGVIIARGGVYAAGIGGGAGQPGTVTITDGDVKAYGGTFGSGIGGGTGWNGYPNVTISGGNVYAEGGNGSGIGNGDEGGHYNIGTVTISGGTIRAHSNSGAGIGAGNASGESGRGPNIYISGGSILALSNSGSPVGPGAGQGTCPDPKTGVGGEVIYLATLPDAMAAPAAGNFAILSAAEDVTFTTKRNGSDYGYTYTGVGFAGTDDAYFYLPDGSYVITGTNGKSLGGTISGADATFVTVPEPAFAALALLALAALLRRK